MFYTPGTFISFEAGKVLSYLIVIYDLKLEEAPTPPGAVKSRLWRNKESFLGWAKMYFNCSHGARLVCFFFELARVETSQHSATPGEEGHSGVKKTCGVEAHSDLGHLTALVFGRWVPVLRPSYEEHSGNTTGQLSTEISLSGRFLLPPAVYRLVAACPTSSSTPKPPDLSHFSVTQSWIYLYCAGGRES